MNFKKQFTYDTDEKAIEKLGYLAKVFYIDKAVISKSKTGWRLVVKWH